MTYCPASEVIATVTVPLASVTTRKVLSSKAMPRRRTSLIRRWR
jgi:hypothetical protein